MAITALARLMLDPEPLTPEMLGLTQATLKPRLEEYLKLAGGSPITATEAQHKAAVALVCGARIVVLEAEVETFRREGKLTLERDLMGRITRLAALRDAALVRASAPAAGSAPDDYELWEWGLRP